MPSPDNRGPCGGGAELFPLPVPHNSFAPHISHLSRKVRSRVNRSLHVRDRARNSVIALNELYGVPAKSGVVASEAQCSALEHIYSCHSSCIPPSDICKPDVALSELLRCRPGYSDDVSNLAPYDSLLLSVPDGSQAVVPLVGLLETCDANLLSGESGGLLRTPDSYDSLINSVGRAKPYMCPCLRDRKNYLSFLRSLVRGGMLVFSRKQKASVTPFFVEKKGKGTIRLILDAREANQYFVDPTNPHMGSGSALANLVVPVGEDMYWATSDLKDAFYGMGIPEWLSVYFALPCLSASEVRSLGGFVGDVPQTTRF